MKSDRLSLTEAEAAEMLGLSTDALAHQRRRGRIGCSRAGRRVLYTRRDLIEWLERTRRPAEAVGADPALTDCSLCGRSFLPADVRSMTACTDANRSTD